MDFYQSIAAYYEQIFPLNRMQIDFVKKVSTGHENTSVLDIGCGTGCLAIELAKVFNTVVGIDLDNTMLEKAREKNAEKVDFKVMNMLDIAKKFGPESFDSVVCFGNTLVHLDSPRNILDFFVQSKKVLKKNGKLLFQIINYDRIIDKGIRGLPTIENDAVQFIRNYTYDARKNRIYFKTVLIPGKSGRQIENTVPLYPLRKSEIEELLSRAGFSKWQFYGNFQRDTLTENSIPLLVEAG